MRRSALGLLLGPSLLGMLFLLLVPSARADYDPIGSGQTRLTFDKGFLKELKAEGVKLTALAPARLSGGVLTVPAVAGKFDPVAAAGTVEGEGSLVFSAGARKVPIKALKLRTTAKTTPFTAKVGGSQLKIATAATVTVGRSGFADTVSVTKLALSQKLATRLGKKLDRRPFFKAGLPLGRASTVAIPQTVTILEEGAATFTLDPGLASKLQSLFVAVNPIFPAEHQGPVFTLPIFVGDLATAAPGGRLDLNGAIEFLQLGGGQVFWREPRLEPDAAALTGEVDVEPSPPFGGKVGRLTLGAENPTAYEANATSRAISGTFSLTLDPAMAATFNETFAAPQGKVDVFTAGEPLGAVSFTALGQ